MTALSHRGPGSDTSTQPAVSRQPVDGGENAASAKANGVVADADQGAKELGVACISLDPPAGGMAELPNGQEVSSHGSLTSTSKGISSCAGTSSTATTLGGLQASSTASAPPLTSVLGRDETLYKCAICGCLVYESDLDAHVEVCPDIAEQPTPEGPRGAGRTVSTSPKRTSLDKKKKPGAPGRSEILRGDARRGGPPRASSASPAMPSSAPSGQGRGGNQRTAHSPKPSAAAAEGNMTDRQQFATERRSTRLEQLEAEVRRREEEECTFAPRMYSKFTPRARGVIPNEYADDARERKLQKVEAQAYAEVTLRPQISPFAQAWSQRQQETTVFERLYKAAQAREERRLEMEAAEIQKSTMSSGLSTSSASKRDQPRRTMPAGELLYSDALDRRDRLKQLAKQLHADQQASDSGHVLSRSRRYYWQMLERQIKAAFALATDGQPVMKPEALEDFLAHFGCKRPARDCCSQGGSPPKAGSPLTQSDSDSNRLCGALWFHLDPDKTGQVDLLTVTVFFHVLMGAVDFTDDATREQRSLFPPGQNSISDDQDSSLLSTPPSSAREGGGSIGAVTPPPAPAPALAAICEEEGSPARSSTPGATPRMASPSSPRQGLTRMGYGSTTDSTTLGEDEGHRICELLLRFDPERLRMEFKQLYMHRLHYQSQQSKAITVEKVEEMVQAPHIDEKSRAMAERLYERRKAEADGKAMSHTDWLLQWQSQVEHKKEKRREQAKDEETIGCTFRPKIVPRNTKPAETVTDKTTKVASRTEVLYAKGLAEKEKRKAQMEAAAKVQSEAEVASCTFAPNTARSRTSYRRVNDTAPVPRGFYESRQRMRAANAVQAQKREQRENRLAKLAPVAATEDVGDSLGLSRQIDMMLPFGSGPVGFDEEDFLEATAPLVPEGVDDTVLSPEEVRWENATTTEQLQQALQAGLDSSQEHGAPAPASPGPITTNKPRTSARRTSPGASMGSRTGPAAKSGPGATGASAGRTRGVAAPKTASRPQRGIERPRAEADVPAGTTPSSTTTALTEDNAAAPLLFVDVNILEGQPPERIVVREGQSASEVAADFAAKHGLQWAQAQQLHSLLQKLMNRQQQQQPQSQQPELPETS